MATKLEIEEAARSEREKGSESPQGKLRDWEVDQLGNIHSKPSDVWRPEPVNVEEELLQDQAKRSEALQEQNQRDRRDAALAQEEEQKQNSPVNQLKEAGKDYAGKVAKTAVKDAAYEGAAAAGSAIAASAPIWGPILAGIAAIAILIAVVLIVMTAGCNAGGLTGFGATALSKISGGLNSVGLTSFPPDVCGALTINSGTQAPTTTGPATGGTSSDEVNRKFLADNGIPVNKPYPQTSLAGMLAATLQEIVSFKQNCDAWAKPQGKSCAVIVTGGTEDAHAEGICSHANGYKVDIGITATIDQYITSTFKDSGIRSDGAHMYTEPGGSVFARETNPAHWDIVTGCVGAA